MTVAWRALPSGLVRRDVSWNLLRDLLPADSRLSNLCPRCGGRHGPVRVAGAPFVASVTYAGGYAVVVVAPTGEVARIGIDAEPADRRVEHGTAPGGVHATGRAITLRDWVRMEATVKADGRGLHIAPERVHVEAADGGFLARIDGGDALPGWDLDGPPGLLVSVVVSPIAAGTSTTATEPAAEEAPAASTRRATP